MMLRVLREYEQNFPERLHAAVVINGKDFKSLVIINAGL